MDEHVFRVLRRNAEQIAEPARRLAQIAEGERAELARWVRTDNGERAGEAYAAVFGGALCTPEFGRYCLEAAGGITDPRLLMRWLPDAAVAEEETSDTHVAYQRNAFSDGAFDAFCARLGALSAQYQPSFNAVCEEIYYGRCGCGILPLQNSEDGLLPSVFRLIAKYDLKILFTCEVAVPERDATIRFALLRRTIYPRAPERGSMQVRVVLPEKIPVGAFLAAAEGCGVTVERLTTMPLTYTEELASLCICFSVTKQTTAPLLLFLSSVLDSYDADGIFEAI